MNYTSKKAYRARSLVLFAILIVGFIYALGFLYYWQFVRGEEFRMKVLDQSLWETELSAQRGTIYDASGKVLAQSAGVWNVVLEPKNIKKLDTEDLQRTKDETGALLADGLSRILGLDREKIYKDTQKDSYFVYVAKKIEDDVKDEIEAFMKENQIYSGVRYISDYKRYYPYGDVGSVVIGFTGTDNKGLLGVEYSYDEELSGTTGLMVSMKDALGGDMPFQYEQYIGAENGYDIVLTLDETVQSICEKYLLEGIENYNVKNGATAIVMDVKTGAILGLATGEKFDLNDPFEIADQDIRLEIESLPEEEQNDAYNTALYKQWRNKAVSDVYYPGSVFKMVTGASALDSGVITKDTTYQCTGSFVPYPGVPPISCWKKYGGGHGVLTVKEGLCNSCNPFFMQVGQAMGSSLFFDYFTAFGFANKTGIDLPGEANSLFYKEEDLGPVELATESFGQNFSITPIQMITAASAIANGGYMVSPHVVDKMLDKDGNIVQVTDDSATRQVISSEVSKIIIDALEENAKSGTASTGYIAGYRIAGKTGTSEKIDKWVAEGKVNPKEYITSYCGFAPADDPQYAVLVYYDEPERVGASGALQAGPTFASIMTEILPYLGVERELDEQLYQDIRTETPALVGMTIKDAKSLIENKGLEWSVYDGIRFYDDNSGNYDENAIVNLQIPAQGYNMPKDGKVIITTQSNISSEHMAVVPDFEGKTVNECYRLAKQAGIQIIIYGTELDGDIRAQTQTQIANKMVKPGTVIEVTVAKFSGVETVPN